MHQSIRVNPCRADGTCDRHKLRKNTYCVWERALPVLLIEDVETAAKRLLLQGGCLMVIGRWVTWGRNAGDCWYGMGLIGTGDE